jgi:presenilin-like A22 family membrane protease
MVLIRGAVESRMARQKPAPGLPPANHGVISGVVLKADGL